MREYRTGLPQVAEHELTISSNSASTQRPWRWVPTGWLAMGLAYAFVTHVAAVLLRDLGLTTAQAILGVSLLGLPYVVKPLYAPLVELHRTKRFFVLVAQVALTLAFVMLAVMILPAAGGAIVALALLAAIAVIGSIQDIACEGLYLTELDRRQQGVFTGVQSIFWNGAALAGGGAVIALSGAVGAGWPVALLLCAGIYAAAAIWHVRNLPVGPASVAPSGSAPGAYVALSSFFRRRGVAANATFCIAFPLSAGLIDKVEPFFIIDPRTLGGLGLGRELLGAVYMTSGFGGLVIGAGLGSLALARHGLDRLMMPMGIAAMAPAAILFGLSLPAAVSPLAVGIACLVAKASLAFGMVGYVVFLQRALSPGPFPTTHYNLASGLKALTMTAAGAASAPLQQVVGYRAVFAIALLAGLSVLALCRASFIADATSESGDPTMNASCVADHA